MFTSFSFWLAIACIGVALVGVAWVCAVLAEDFFGGEE